ncbi:MAG: SMP-30/gluconolactonase/LRE family protein [Alphaproteobacteria bacterium]|jgi:sugar lactone lactonase YvrE|nr:SMP-30/gluconolactonase/LRE family protein [Alphaproteobacteria bacterium]
MPKQTTALLEGLTFPEGPRWHDGRLWFSDFYAHEVVAVDLDGRRETMAEVPGQPSGLGWTPDGRLLVVSMTDRRLLRQDPGGLVEVADLSGLAGYHCNDMVVDGDGGAYVGNFGYNSHDGDDFKLADLIRVEPDGTASVAAAGLAFPNGSVITPDGGTLIVGETRGHILSAWDRAADGGLSNRRVWADLDGGYPDGICLDAEGAVWVSDPRNKETIRVLEGGEVTERISTGDYGSFACMLGGGDRRTLFICTCLQSGPGTAELRSGRIETVQVEVPGAGWP